MQQPLPWLETDTPFPPLHRAWSSGTEAPGLLAAGASLAPHRLIDAYSQGIFPWYSEGQPILWWSPDPRMVLTTEEFKFHRSLQKKIHALNKARRLSITVDSAFTEVIHHCATKPRPGQSGTWIVRDMVQAYQNLYALGYAHSVETWIDGQLAGGLYCINVGQAVFGESMFWLQPDASKIALAALVAFCKSNAIAHIDCQQDTTHLGFMGARPIARDVFQGLLRATIAKPSPKWVFESLYWNALTH